MAVKGGIWRLASLIVAMAHASPTAADDGAAAPRADRDASSDRTVNDGEDFTSPIRRFDLRGRYERLPGDGGSEPEKWVTTLRTDLGTALGRGWRLYGRVDLPLFTRTM